MSSSNIIALLVTDKTTRKLYLEHRSQSYQKKDLIDDHLSREITALLKKNMKRDRDISQPEPSYKWIDVKDLPFHKQRTIWKGKCHRLERFERQNAELQETILKLINLQIEGKS